MKNYVSPRMVVKNIMSEKSISSLGEWLQHQGAEYNDAGIVTYVMASE